MNQDVAIERRLLSFMEELVIREKIDLIVCSERKGTAVMRALIQEIGAPKLNWPWVRVVSTAAIEEFDWSAFKGERILFFDELVHHGYSLERAKAKLLEVTSGRFEIKTAGFAVWDRCLYRPDFSYYAAVDIEQYVEIRDAIIKMLQQYGSLLLDTEHIEISVRLECGLKEFYQELARASDAGNTFSFLSASDRLNLTIWNPDVIEPEELNRWLIPGSNTKAVVSKCRVLEKDHSHFSIMPIFYPNTRCVIDEGWISNLPSFIDRESLRSARPTYLFYLVGLLASLEVLKVVVASISDLIKAQKIVLEVPKEDFTHLKAMFPMIDTDKLWEYVRNIVSKGKLHKVERSSRGVDVQHVPEKKLANMSYFLITRMMEEIDKNGADCGLHGVPWLQLDRIARDAKESINELSDVDHRWWSIVPDRLIDTGLMHTNVEEVISSVGDPWAIRTFGPDSEVVAEKLRRQMSVRGAKWLPAT
ncbi:MAG TPA: hypothetical protein VLJ61_09555 [Pyrinomonadaceae bacterium]|nr:hypothetical protein [Pyrinomonadaceae bacterium]